MGPGHRFPFKGFVEHTSFLVRKRRSLTDRGQTELLSGYGFAIAWLQLASRANYYY